MRTHAEGWPPRTADWDNGERQPRTAAAGMGQNTIGATAENGCCRKGTEYNENRH